MSDVTCDGTQNDAIFRPRATTMKIRQECIDTARRCREFWYREDSNNIPTVYSMSRDATSHPWQLDWKRPRWERPKAPQVLEEDGELCNNEKKDPVSLIRLQAKRKRRVVHHVAAAVLPAEIQHAAEAIGITSSHSLVLTVTLVSSEEKSPFADQVRVDLLSQDNNNHQKNAAILSSRVLHWPNQQQNDTGLVACALSRRLMQSNEQSAQQDAVKLLQRLGLEDVSTKTTSTVAARLPTDDGNNDNHHAQQPDAELLLACLTNTGKVHFYRPLDWISLTKSKSDNDNDNSSNIKSPEDHLQDTLESLFLGSDLLASIKKAILPLSQPIHTVSLDIGNIPKRNRQHSWWRQGESLMTQQGEDDETDNEQDDAQNTAENSGDDNLSLTRLPIWDPSVWNTSIDLPSTRYFETKRHTNIPTHCVTAFGHVVVVGRGKKKRKERHRLVDRDQKKRTTTSSAASSNANSYTATTVTTNTNQTNQLASRSNGGFVIFISLHNLAEERIVYLPFVPRDVAPLLWKGIEFLLVLGTTAEQALVIRMDEHVEDHASFACGHPPVHPSAEERQSTEDAPTVSSTINTDAAKVAIHRFQMMPVQLPNAQDLTPLLLPSPMYIDPPAVAFVIVNNHEEHVSVLQRLFKAVDLVPRDSVATEALFESYHSMFGEMQPGRLPVIQTELSQAHVARVAVPTAESIEDVTNNLSSTVWGQMGQGWCLVGVRSHQYFVCWEGATSASGAFVTELAKDDDEIEYLDDVQVLSVPILPSTAVDHIRNTYLHIDNLSSTIISLADDSMDVTHESAASCIELDTLHRMLNKMTDDPSLSTAREKAISLMRTLTSSRVTADLKSAAPIQFDQQKPLVSVCFGDTKRDIALLSLRQSSEKNGAASSFGEVLEWLSREGDFFSAASVALDLLRDADSLRVLWRSFEKIEDDCERAKLEGLLDGIRPIYDTEDEPLAGQTTLSHLADMTISLLIHGGWICSQTLEHFLKSNKYYDKRRVCVMLTAATKFALSDEDTSVDLATGLDFDATTRHSDHVLWPLRCLLCTAVGRENLATTINFLDYFIPDELRNYSHRRGDAPDQSMELCLALVHLILSASPDGADILLGLVDATTGVPYWQSLDRDTQLELTRLSLNGKHLMLLQPEVRSWVLMELQTDMLLESKATVLPTKWLKELAHFCTNNAGCDTGILTLSKATGVVAVDRMTLYRGLIRRTRQAFQSSPGSGGLDFDILISVLLLLQSRDGGTFIDDTAVGTQSIINAVCFLAGRKTTEDPRFAIDGMTLARQCALLNNIQAGAHLIGGEYGATLECCDVIHRECGLGIDNAESFLLAEPVSPPPIANESMQTSDFELNDSYCHILWLLEEYVLRVRTFGEFDVDVIPGKIRPVFAAKLCLRTWWCVTRNCLVKASPWLEQWLRVKLEMSHGKLSPYRLACAALIRALLWPSMKNSHHEAVLATMLNLSPEFIVSLSRSSCGLFEALPMYTLEQNWTHAEDRNKTVSGIIHAGVTEEQSIDDSFVSAVSSIPAADWSYSIT